MQDATELEVLASILAALCHDVGHPGFNNRYLINTKSSFALICNSHVDNDISVLEMMHTALAFELLQQNQFLSPLSPEQWTLVRKIIVEMVLATDMMRHFELVGVFRAKYMTKEFPLRELDDRLSAYKMCIKCADVGHAAKSVTLHENWSWKVVEEFFHQGDLERDQHLTISAFCDRNNSDVPNNQSGFILNIVKPMFEALNALTKSENLTTNCLEQLDENVNHWKSKRRSKRAITIKEVMPGEAVATKVLQRLKSTVSEQRMVVQESKE